MPQWPEYFPPLSFEGRLLCWQRSKPEASDRWESKDETSWSTGAGSARPSKLQEDDVSCCLSVQPKCLLRTTNVNEAKNHPLGCTPPFLPRCAFIQLSRCDFVVDVTVSSSPPTMIEGGDDVSKGPTRRQIRAVKGETRERRGGVSAVSSGGRRASLEASKHCSKSVSLVYALFKAVESIIRCDAIDSLVGTTRFQVCVLLIESTQYGELWTEMSFARRYHSTCCTRVTENSNSYRGWIH